MWKSKDGVDSSLTFPQNQQNAYVHHDSTIPSLNTLSTVTEDEVRKIIMSGNSKSCALDPIPTKLLKTCIDCLLPSVTKIINASIETSLFPPQFKTASVAPVLKKPTLDKDELSNYRPVSNLPYLGKITEKVVVKQLKEYLKDHDLN